MKKCGFCAEDIQDAAIVCKHCGRDLKGGASQVQILQPKKKTSVAGWGCLTIILLIVGLAIIGSLFGTSTPQRGSAPTAGSSPIITAEDMKREQTGRFGARSVSAIEKDGQWAVMFDPALPRDDRTVLNGAEYALREFVKVKIDNSNWRPEGQFLRLVTGGETFDVLLIKNDDGTVQGMTIAKR